MTTEEAIRRYNALRGAIEFLYEELYGTWWGVKACTGLLRILNRHPQLPDQPEGGASILAPFERLAEAWMYDADTKGGQLRRAITEAEGLLKKGEANERV